MTVGLPIDNLNQYSVSIRYSNMSNNSRESLLPVLTFVQKTLGFSEAILCQDIIWKIKLPKLSETELNKVVGALEKEKIEESLLLTSSRFNGFGIEGRNFYIN